MRFGSTLLLIGILALAGCELTIPGVYPNPRTLEREANAKATGGGCRHALRSVEDCYVANPKQPRASVFEGWKEMDSYMRENKIEGVAGKPFEAPEPGEE